MAKPPVAFPGLEPAAWDAAAKTIARNAARDIERLTAGTLTRGREARLRSLMESLRQLYALSTDEAWVAARAVGSTSSRLSASLERVLASVPDSTWTAVEASSAWVAAKGAPVILSEGAMSAIVARTQQAITADWTRLAARTQTGIVSTLRQSVIGGLGARDAAAAMYQGIYGQTGLTYSRALTIARTELADAYQSANLTTYLHAGATHYEWWADTTSSRTCAMCLALHGTVYPINEVPPEQHHNCRCEMLPVFPNEMKKVGADQRMPGTRVPNSTIQQRVPKSWGTLPSDPRTLIGRTDIPGWRGVKTWQRPTGAPSGGTPIGTAPTSTSKATLWDSADHRFADYRRAGMTERSSLHQALPPQERAEWTAWNNYIADAEDMNMMLREGQLHPQLRPWVDDLTRAINTAPRTKQEMTVWRGAQWPDEMIDDFFQPGYSFVDDGFLSTTVDRKVAEGFGAAWADDTSILFQIRIPKGAKGMVGDLDEAELLLQRGSRLRILSRERVQGPRKDNWWLIKAVLEVVT